MKIKSCDTNADLVIAGAGVAGICTAIQASRLGLKVILVNDRGYPGGNSSAEITVSIDGSEGTSEFNLHSRASGIVDELLIERHYRTPLDNHYIWDSILNDYIKNENISYYPNTYVDSCKTDNEGNIICISGSQNTSETRFNFFGKYFVDNTGDGVLGFICGADFKKGRESKYEFDEDIALEKSDNCVIPGTLSFYARDTGKKVNYIAPDFAYDITKGDTLKYREIPRNGFWRFLWYYEIGGEDIDQIYDGQKIIEKHQALTYGIWDYVKNSGKYPEAENFDLSYVASKPGKRESRRLLGRYILKQSDITEQTDYEDTVGHGGWSIDLHAVDGFFSKDFSNFHYFLKGIYKIPLGSCISRNINNLFMVGRCMSTTHVAFGSTRVMGTLATMAQGVGTAAFLCKKHGILPSDIYTQKKCKELQQILLRNDHFVLGVKNEDENDLALDAVIEASSTKKCELTDQSSSIVLEKAVGLSIPAKGFIKKISILVKSLEDTYLNYNVYKSSKPENYDPAVILLQKKAFVRKSEDFHWLDLSIDLNSECENLFFEFDNNINLTLGTSRYNLSGTACLVRKINACDRCVDIDTKATKKYFWLSLKNEICFKLDCDFELFSASNINNGFSRPYCGTNLWLSENKAGDEYLSLKFKDKKVMQTLIIRFDPDYNFRISPSDKTEDNVLPKIVKEYEVLTKESDSYKSLSLINNNYKRQNIINLNGVNTDELKIVFKQTNGYPYVGVYEVRIY